MNNQPLSNLGDSFRFLCTIGLMWVRYGSFPQCDCPGRKVCCPLAQKWTQLRRDLGSNVKLHSPSALVGSPWPSPLTSRGGGVVQFPHMINGAPDAYISGWFVKWSVYMLCVGPGIQLHSIYIPSSLPQAELSPTLKKMKQEGTDVCWFCLPGAWPVPGVKDAVLGLSRPSTKKLSS